MRNQIEVARKVRVHHLHLSAQQGFLNLIHRLMSPTLRSVGVGVVVEVRLPDWLQHDRRRTLHHPIFDRGDTQRSAFFPGLILPYIDAQDRTGSVGNGAKLRPISVHFSARDLDTRMARRGLVIS